MAAIGAMVAYSKDAAIFCTSQTLKFGQSHQKCRVTSLPKGASDRRAILKCCRAKGMPIIVTNSSMPKNMCVSHAHNPPKTIQMIFRGIVIHPDGDAVSLTSAPKGQRHSSPILNV